MIAGEICFNAGRLDVSVELSVADYLTLARPRVASIAAPLLPMRYLAGVEPSVRELIAMVLVEMALVDQ